MITYTVKYKLPNQWFWKKLTNIREDGIVEEIQQRWFYNRLNERFEVPNTCQFKFSPERHELIEEIQEKNKTNITDKSGMTPY